MSRATLLWTLKALLGHWRRRPAQFAAFFLGLALATALWSGVQGVNAQARDAYARAAAMLGGADIVTIARPEGGDFDQSLFVTLRRAGWLVSPVVEGRVRVGDRLLRVVGVEPLTLPPGGALASGGGEAADAGALLGAEPAGFVAPETLAALEDGPRATGTGRALPTLVARAGVAEATLLADIGLAQRLLGLDGRVTRLIAAPGLPGGDAALAALTDGRLAIREADQSGDLDRLTDSFHLNLTAFAFLSFAVGLFIAHATVGLAFEQRRPTIRTLRACGVPARALGAALLLELAGFALAAGMVGMALGYVVAGLLLPDVAATLRGLYGAPVEGRFSLAPEWWLSGLAMSLAGALAAAGGKLLAAWRLPPLAAARPMAWLAAHRRADRHRRH